MNWGGIWHLGTRYLNRRRTKTALLIAAFTLVWLLPLSIALIVETAQTHLRLRSDSTPLVLGRSGSPLELVLNALYFSKPSLDSFPLSETRTKMQGIKVIPIYARFHSQDDRIVGTTIDYFSFRQLRLASGRPFVRMGECVVGAKVATKRGISVGDAVISSPESLLDIAGVYPLKMKVCGILTASGTPDDDAIFIDLKTAWVIEGLGHGHEDADKIGASGQLQPDSTSGQERGTIQLNASVDQYNEITPENAASFHFHGDPGTLPITAGIAIPENAKAQALLKGRIQNRADMQVVSPAQEMDEVFATVWRVQRFLSWILALIGLATLAIGILVFSLSNRLRVGEFESLFNMGADPAFLRGLVFFEALFVLFTSGLITLTAMFALHAVVPLFIRNLF